MESNRDFQEKAHRFIPGGAHTYSRGDDQYPLNAPSVLARGKGAYVWDPDPKQDVLVNNCNLQTRLAGVQSRGMMLCLVPGSDRGVLGTAQKAAQSVLLLGAEPTPARTQTVLVGCPPGEWHTFMPLLMALLLRRRGLNVVYLGANVPIDQFEESLAAIRPQLVVLVAQQLTSAASLQQIALPLASRGMTVAFGGRIFTLQPGLQRAISGHFLGDRLDSAIQNIEGLLESRPQFPQPVLPSKEHLETLKLFTSKRALIEMSLNESISKNYTGSLEFVETANHFLGDKISASLQLGSLEYLTSEIDWLNTLLRSHQMPIQLVRQYLETYAGAVRQHLGSQGSLIVNWINSQTS